MITANQTAWNSNNLQRHLKVEVKSGFNLTPVCSFLYFWDMVFALKQRTWIKLDLLSSETSNSPISHHQLCLGSGLVNTHAELPIVSNSTESRMLKFGVSHPPATIKTCSPAQNKLEGKLQQQVNNEPSLDV